MKDPEAWLTRTMRDMGHDALVPSTESAPASVWVDDNVPAPGYYEKCVQPLPHRMLRDERVFAFEFTRDATTYRIRCGSEDSIESNTRRVAEVIGTLLQWIDARIVTWSEAFAGFVVTDESVQWWRVLRVSPDATRSEIETAYKLQAFQAHPDRGGDADRFRRVRAAYEQALRVAR